MLFSSSEFCVSLLKKNKNHPTKRGVGLRVYRLGRTVKEEGIGNFLFLVAEA